MAGVTRAVARQTVARMLNDYYEGTDETGGQTGQLTDLYNFARETGFFNGMEVFFSDPDSGHYGHIATVTRSDGPTRTIYFEPPLDSGAEAGETVELYNFKGRGTRIAQYNASIADAVRMARDLHDLRPVVVVGDDIFNGTPGELEIPEELESFYGISFDARDGRTHMVRPQDMRVDRFQRTVYFSRSSAAKWNGYTPTFHGYALPAIPDSDDDVIAIESEWLFNEVKAQILERMFASGMPLAGQDRLYLQERTEASGKRPMIVTRAMPNTVRLS